MQVVERINVSEEERILTEQWMGFDAKTRARIAGEVESARKQPEYRLMKPAALRVDETYQRAVSHERVMDIVTNFDWTLYNALWVADRKRTGNLYIVDGRHRLYAAMILGVKEVWCEVRATTGPEEEARIFVALTTKRRHLNSAQKFQARLIYGDEAAVRIEKLVGKHRFQIQDPAVFGGAGIAYMKDDVIGAVGTLEAIFTNGGTKLLDRVLYTLRKAWNGHGGTLQSKMIRAIARLYERHPDADNDAVARALGEKEPLALIERGVRFGLSNKVIQTEAITDVLEKVAGL